MSLNSLRLIKIIKIISMTTHASILSIFASTKLVFSRWPYIVLGGAVTILFWIIFNVFDQLLFFFPVVTCDWRFNKIHFGIYILSLGVVVAFSSHYTVRCDYKNYRSFTNLLNI
jgi:hypothetical protein